MENHQSPPFSPQQISRSPPVPPTSMPGFRSPPPQLPLPTNGQMSPNQIQAFSPLQQQPQQQQQQLPVSDGASFASSMHRRNGTGPNSGFPFREPPAAQTKNTSHVPCKFFRLGNCQAGKACPFSHALDTINDPAPCKYFAKGNCKYGHKCANPHLLPDGRDGRRLNHGRRGYAPENGGFNIGPPAHPYSDQMPQNAFPVLPPGAGQPDHYSSVVDESYPSGLQQRSLDTLPTIDQAYNSPAAFHFGSPPRESRQTMSPPIRALDAQLPSSFDSNEVSNVARYGHIASSVPSRFGFGPSSPTVSTATSNVFGNLGHMAKGESNGGHNGIPGIGSRPANMGSSPPRASENAFPKRILHSDRISQPQHIASSLPVPRALMRDPKPEDSDEDYLDEDKIYWLPGALKDDVMTPQEKMRRFSRQEDENPLSFKGSSLSGIGSAPDSKVGSPSNASPASRWGALFAQQQQRQQESHDFPSTSPYGHVGSPLRNSSLPSNASPSIKPIGRPTPLAGEMSPFGMSSPPKNRPVSGTGIGLLSEQLKNSRLRESSTATDQTPHPPAPPAIRTISNGSVASLVGSSRLDRAISSSSISRSDRIDEEPYLFEMDEVDMRVKELKNQNERERQKRWSGGLPFGGSPWNQTSAEPEKNKPSIDQSSNIEEPADATEGTGESKRTHLA